MQEITTSQIFYEVDGLTMVAHLARPNGQGPFPAVLIGHDGVGLDDYQRGRADDLARHGYVAFAMDFHGGQTFFGRPDAMLARTMPLLADKRRMETIGRVALDLLLSTSDIDSKRLFALGYGAGGAVVFELCKCGVSFNGCALVHPALPKPGAQSWNNPGSTFFLCTGSEDPICTPAELLAFGRSLQAAGIDWHLNIYGGAEHAFWSQPTNSDGLHVDGVVHVQATVPGVSYHPKHTERAWRDVLDFFESESK